MLKKNKSNQQFNIIKLEKHSVFTRYYSIKNNFLSKGYREKVLKRIVNQTEKIIIQSNQKQ